MSNLQFEVMCTGGLEAAWRTQSLREVVLVSLPFATIQLDSKEHE